MGESPDTETPSVPTIALGTAAAAGGRDEAGRGAAASTVLAAPHAAHAITATTALEAREATAHCVAACLLAVAAALVGAARSHAAGGDAAAILAALVAADPSIVVPENPAPAAAGEVAPESDPAGPAAAENGAPAAAGDAAGGHGRPPVALAATTALLGEAAAEHSVTRAVAVVAAALAAQEAAAAARAKAAEDNDDNMRGWLMTVATLLVNMTFQAVLHPPGWMPLEFAVSRGLVGGKHRKLTGEVKMAVIYFSMNAATFAVGLTVIVMLLTMRKAPQVDTMKTIRMLMVTLAGAVACSFASGASKHPRVAGFIFGVLSLYAFIALVIIRAKFYNLDRVIRKFMNL